MRFPIIVIGMLLSGVLLQSPPANAADAPTPSDRLIAEVAARNQLMPNLEEMCDGIGPRLTGSPQLRLAQEWAMAKLKAYGAVNVHLEPYDMGRPWLRGAAHARLLNANGLTLNIAQKAWTTGTPGKVRADVALLNVKTLSELRAAAPALRGKIVLAVSDVKPNDQERQHIAEFDAEADRIVDQAGFAGLLLIANRGDGLLDMWGGSNSRYQHRVAIITREHAAMLQRLLARGVVPRLELELTGHFGSKPIQAYNVVADIPGADNPDEMVILGVHQDSFDLSTGATDNGAGTVVALEVARAMLAQNLKPKRTLRIVLFSGEEQGLWGSQAYVAAHRAELDKIQAVLVQDAGAGRVQGFPDMKVDAWYDAMNAAVAGAAPVGPLEVVYGTLNGSDQVSFFKQGIPAFGAVQDLRDYREHTHHSDIDTVDRVVPADLVQGAQAMAATAWGLLNGPRIPHQHN
ncbi:MAG TPA: M20/M25/M40 family metallo-hydrolase [Telluria sp.]|nr:M20/M25/M40 family metallo-hydrolase [Telluria sp.]